MKLVLKTPHEAPCQAGKDFSVVTFCETTANAKISEILQLLQKNLKREQGRLLYQLWNIEVLAFSELRELGAIEAAQADMIILGVRAGRDLPGTVAAWIKRWLDLRPRRPGALVAVLEADPKKPEASRAALVKLKEAAAAGSLDFFSVEAKAGRDDVVYGVSEAARQFVTARKNGLPGVLPGGWQTPVDGFAGGLRAALKLDYDANN